MEAEHPLAVAFERYAPQLRRYLWKRSADVHAAEDLLQLTFLEAWRTFDRYEDRGFPISAWLFTIARSRLSDHHRASMRRASETAIETWHASAEDLLVQAEASEERAQLWAAVARLPARQRLVVELRFRDDRELTKVAAVMGVSVGTVKALQHRAVANLSKALSD